MNTIGSRPLPNAAGSLQPVSAVERTMSRPADQERADLHAAARSGAAPQASPDQKVVQPVPAGGTPGPETLSGMAERPVSPFDAAALQTLMEDQTKASEERLAYARGALIAHLSAMSDADRAEFAKALEQALNRGPKRTKKP